MFIRFVVGLEGAAHRSLTGIITEARLLRERGGLDGYALLNECGVPVRMLRSASPGKILYEDSHQVVVEEWARLER